MNHVKCANHNINSLEKPRDKGGRGQDPGLNESHKATPVKYI